MRLLLPVLLLAALHAAEGDEYEEEATMRVRHLIDTDYGGDWRPCFRNFDADGNGLMVFDEIYEMLTAADLGNFLTRAEWVKGIMEKVDLNKDSSVTRDELEQVFYPDARRARRYRKILTMFYKKHRPEKLDDVEALLTKLVASFQGTERSLVRLLKKKYQVAGDA